MQNNIVINKFYDKAKVYCTSEETPSGGPGPLKRGSGERKQPIELKRPAKPLTDTQTVKFLP